MHDKLEGQIDELLNLLDGQKSGAIPSSGDGQGTIEIIDVYVVTHQVEEPDESAIVESGIEASQEQDSQETTEVDAARAPRQSRPHFHLFPIVVGILCFLLLVGGGLFSFLSLTEPSATVIITPISAQIEITTTISVVSGTANRALHQVRGRMLSSIAMTEMRPVPTTGIVHQDATQARGTVTFYNGLIQPQMIPAGTLLISNDGVQVATDQNAYIPQASLPAPGQVTVPARALNAGPQGDIGVDAIYGPCCRAYVSVQNTQPFAGGHNARTYRSVSQQDISRGTSLLSTDLGQSMQVAFQAQLQADETLVTPMPCRQTVMTDHATGTEAQQVHITLGETCAGEAYNTQDYHELMTLILSGEAMRQLGPGYTLTASIQAAIDKVIASGHVFIAMKVRGAGTCLYRFTQAQLQRIKAIIAGKSKQEATRLLLQIQGVQTAVLTLKHGTRVPASTANVHILVLETT